VDHVDALIDEPPAERLVDRPGFGLPVRSPVERGDDEVGVVCRRAVENLFDERARRGHRRIERCERGPRFRLGRRELLGLVGEAERRDGQVARLEHCGFERGLPVSAGAGVRDPASVRWDSVSRSAGSR